VAAAAKKTDPPAASGGSWLTLLTLILLVVGLVVAGNVIYQMTNQPKAPGNYNEYYQIPFSFPNASTVLNPGQPVKVVIDWTSATATTAGGNFQAALTIIYPPGKMVSNSWPQSLFRQVRTGSDVTGVGVWPG
jgi:hypothetical protein